jgi:hypothetical protein
MFQSSYGTGKLNQLINRIIIFIFIFLSISYFSNAKELKSNLQILDSFSLSQSKQIAAYFENKTIDSLQIVIPGNQGWLFKEKIITLIKNKINILNTDSNLNKKNILEIHLKEFSSVYSLYINNDSIIRNIKSEISVSYKNKNNLLEIIPVSNLFFCDTLSLAEAEFVRNNLNEATNPSIPKPPTTFFREIAEPIALIAVSVISIALLFTVRSK